MQANNNIKGVANTGKILVDRQDTYEYLYKLRDLTSFHNAMQKLDTFTKQGDVNIEIGKLASGGGVISTINKEGTKEIIAADGRDIVKCMQVALKKLEEGIGNAVKSVSKSA